MKNKIPLGSDVVPFLLVKALAEAVVKRSPEAVIEG